MIKCYARLNIPQSSLHISEVRWWNYLLLFSVVVVHIYSVPALVFEVFLTVELCY